MFVDLFGLTRFEYETVVRFLITVKKNYREVAYHNWTHGFHVANSIYSILKSSPGVFRPLEVWFLKFTYYSLSYKIMLNLNSNKHESITFHFQTICSVCRCLLGQYVTIWTIEDSTINSWSMWVHPWQQSTRPQPWNIIISIWPLPYFNR